MEATQLIFAAVSGAIIYILVGKWIANFWFFTNKKLNIAEAQLHLLKCIAEKDGVDTEEINRAISHANGEKTLY